jgi:hypothetical protein
MLSLLIAVITAFSMFYFSSFFDSSFLDSSLLLSLLEVGYVMHLGRCLNCTSEPSSVRMSNGYIKPPFSMYYPHSNSSSPLMPGF